jgi:hypothetical protein
MPLENVAPNRMPRLAIIRMVRMEVTREPMAEFKKFTASLLTPTIKSTKAVMKSMAMRIVKRVIEAMILSRARCPKPET